MGSSVVWKHNGQSITFAGTFTCQDPGNGAAANRCQSVQSISIEIYQSNGTGGVFNDGPTPTGHRVAVFTPSTPATFPVTGTSNAVAWNVTQTVGSSPLNLSDGAYEVRVKMTYKDINNATQNATDATNNSTGGDEFGIDNVAPTISNSLNVSPVGSWFNIATGAPTVHFSCADTGGSGLASCTGDHLFGNGAGQSLLGTATDNAGNSATSSRTGVN